MIRYLSAFILILFFTPYINGQNEYTPSEIVKLINQLRKDPRGPYKDIKWFCEDGSMREARDPCPDDMEGVQHARYKDIIIDLGNRNHLYFGQILTGTEPDNFWDKDQRNARFKQFIIEQFLINVDVAVIFW